MSPIQIIFSADFMIAMLVYGIAIIICMPLFDRIHNSLNHSTLQWSWDHIGMPLLQAGLMVLFIVIAYPLIFGLKDAPSITSLIVQEELRLNHLINLIFILTLLFPLIPVIGTWGELVLPIQGIVACMLIFSWLADQRGLAQYSFWPGLEVIFYCLILAIITHWLAINLSRFIGHKFDETFNVTDSGELFSRSLVLFMQSPVILLFSTGLGKQLI